MTPRPDRESGGGEGKGKTVGETCWRRGLSSVCVHYSPEETPLSLQPVLEMRAGQDALPFRQEGMNGSHDVGRGTGGCEERRGGGESPVQGVENPGGTIYTQKTAGGTSPEAEGRGRNGESRGRSGGVIGSVTGQRERQGAMACIRLPFCRKGARGNRKILCDRGGTGKVFRNPLYLKE